MLVVAVDDLLKGAALEAIGVAGAFDAPGGRSGILRVDGGQDAERGDEDGGPDICEPAIAAVGVRFHRWKDSTGCPTGRQATGHRSARLCRRISRHARLPAAAPPQPRASACNCSPA